MTTTTKKTWEKRLDDLEALVTSIVKAGEAKDGEWPANSIRAHEKTGDTTVREHNQKMEKVVHEAIQNDKRFNTPKPQFANSDYRPRPYVVDILTPDGDGQHNAVISTADGRMVKHGFDYDHDIGEAKLAEGEPKETDRHTVYCKFVEQHEETIKAAGNSEGAKKGWEKRHGVNSSIGQMKEAAKHRFGAQTDGTYVDAGRRAGQASLAAHRSSALAQDYIDHEYAAVAHLNAQIAHEHAATTTSDKEEKAMETKLAGEHKAKMIYHRGPGQLEGKTKASDATEQPENIIRCRASHGLAITGKDWVQGKAVEFPYVPMGKHTITAGFRKSDVITIALDVDKDTAGELQESFDHLTATNPQQEPYADEDHEGRKATLRFPAGKVKFVAGKATAGEEVILVKGAEPTSYGADSVNGKVYRSWSPEFSTDADYAKAEEKDGHYTFPKGVRGSASNPARITGVNFVTGALTNKPAFKAMPPVKAKEADVEDKVPEKKEEPVKPRTADEVLKSFKKQPTPADTVLAKFKPTAPAKRTSGDILKKLSAVAGGTGRP